MSEPVSGSLIPLGQSSILAFSTVVLVAALLSLGFRTNELVPDLPLTEDAYYSFSVAANLVEGRGFTVDGSHKTNGFQPLFTIALAPLFAVSDLTSLRLVLILQVVLFVLTAYILGLISRDRAGSNTATPWVRVTMVLYLSASFAMRTHLNGLETGALLLGYALMWRWSQTRGLATYPQALAFGAGAGMLVLTRIDSGFVLAAFAILYLIAERTRLSSAARRILVMTITAFAVSSPWWRFNLIEFGSIMPTSATAQQYWGFHSSRIDDLIESIAQAVVPWAYLGDRFASYWPIPVAGSALVATLIVRFVASSNTKAIFRRDRSFELSVIVGGIGLAVWYFFSSWAVHFYPRYLALLMLPAVVAWSRLAVRLLQKCPTWGMSGLAALTVISTAYTLTFHSSELFSGSSMYRQQVPLVAHLVPDGEVVAAGQSGTLGFFRNRTVNLDGKVNYEVVYRQSEISAYLADSKIRWVCDWPSYLQRYLGSNPSDQGWTKAGELGRFVCYQKDYS